MPRTPSRRVIIFFENENTKSHTMQRGGPPPPGPSGPPLGPPGSRRISTLAGHLHSDVDDLVGKLQQVSIDTKPAPLPPQTAHAIGKWTGGPHYIEFSFDSVWLIDPREPRRPISFFQVPEVLQQARGRGQFELIIPGLILVVILPPSTTRQGSMRVDVSEHRDRYIDEQMVLSEIRKAFHNFKSGRIVFTQLRIVSIVYHMHIYGPSIDLETVRRKLHGDDDRMSIKSIVGGSQVLFWDFSGGKRVLRGPSDFYTRYDNVAFSDHPATPRSRSDEGHIYVDCTAQDRRYICGMATQLAWGVGGSIV